jgi:hypothetical protein
MLQEISAVLEDADKTMLLTKGAALAFGGVYPQPHTRLGSDIDFLCHPDDKEAIVAALIKTGFRNAEPEYPLEYYFRFRGEVALFKPGAHRQVIEIHWTGPGRIYHGRRLGYAQYLPHSRPSCFGPGLRLLNPEYAFLLVIQHLGKHLRHLRPIWLMDLLLLSRQSGFDWRQLARAIDRSGLHWPALHVIRWARVRYPKTVPGALPRFLRRRSPKPPCNWIDQRLCYSPHEAAVRWLDALGLPTWRQRFGYWAEHVWPSRSVMERMYPEASGHALWPYHLRRWWRLMKERVPLLFGISSR